MNRVARSCVDISPKTPQWVCGHGMRHAQSTGCHDALEAHVTLLEIDGKICCFVNADLIVTTNEFVNEFKEVISKRYGWDKNLIVLSVTHTHTGPCFGIDFGGERDFEYEKEVFDLMVDAVEEATTKFVPFDQVTVRQDHVYGYYGNRNRLDKDGDQLVSVIEFKYQEEVVAAMVHMSCHSTVLNPMETELSADLLGNVRRELTPYLGVEPMMMNGNAGDMSNRLYRHNNDFAELKRVCSGIASRVAGFNHSQVIELSKAKAHAVDYVVDYDYDVPSMKVKLEELKKQLEVTTEFEARKWLLSEIPGFERRIRDPHVHVEIPSTVIRLGDLELVVVPCELASAFGKQIKRSSNAKVCLVWGYANGFSTYVVEASEFNGGHDGLSTNLRRGDAEVYVGKLIQNLF